jgi:hypothetical protein
MPELEDELIYCRNNKDMWEMWAPLLEKAYAKLNGSYEFLDGGDPVDGMIEMTGGVHEEYRTRSKYKYLKLSPKILWELIYKSLEMKSLISASTDEEASYEAQKYGICSGHAYSVLDAFEILEDENGIYNDLRKSYIDKPEGNKIKLLK